MVAQPCEGLLPCRGARPLCVWPIDAPSGERHRTLRVYSGLDSETRQRRYATRTVHHQRAAAVALAELVENAAYTRLRAGTVGELLERWMATASPDWSASTVRETRSLMRCHLIPHLGHIPVTKLTAADIDDFYSHLSRHEGRNRSLSPSTVHRVHVVLRPALTQAVRWEWIWLNPAAQASPPRVGRPTSDHRQSSRSADSSTSSASRTSSSSPTCTSR